MTKKRFWKDCLRALRPGGALGINWAEFVGESRMQDEARAIAGAIGRSFFLTERVSRPQRGPARADRAGLLAARSSPSALRRFAETYRLPREDREILRRNDVLTHNPLIAKLALKSGSSLLFAGWNRHPQGPSSKGSSRHARYPRSPSHPPEARRPGAALLCEEGRAAPAHGGARRGHLHVGHRGQALHRRLLRARSSATSATATSAWCAP